MSKLRELIDKYCKTKGINIIDILKPEFMEKILKKYSFKDWDSILASVGHGGLKEGQIVNKLQEEVDKKAKKKIISDEEILNEISNGMEKRYYGGAKGGIVVKGIHDVSVRYSKCCNPVPGDEIVGFVTRGRGVSIHRTDCVNVMSLPEIERARLIEAEWQNDEDNSKAGEKYLAEIQIFARNRTGLLADISKIFTEKEIDVQSINSRTSKQEIATISMTFLIGGKSELTKLIEKIRAVDSIIDIARTAG